MNRKGDLFMLGLNLLFLIALILIFWKLSSEFEPKNPGEGLGTRQTAVLNTYAVSERMLLFIDTAALFTAYETMDALSANGLVNSVTNDCGTYATYASWTSPTGTCISSQEELDADFEKEFLRVLRSHWTLPGLPAGITYSMTTTRTSDGLFITGTTEDEIVLPIITAKGRTQREITELMFDENVAAVSFNTFPPDYALAAVHASLYRAPRTTGISRVIVAGSGTEHVADSLQRYTETSTSVHYLVDDTGGVFQLVPEREKAVYCAEECDDDSSLMIIIVNEQTHTDEKYERLVELAADVVKRNTLRPEAITIDGDGFPPEFNAADFISSVTKRVEELKLPESPAEENTSQEPPLITTWPTNLHTVSSCFGPRPYVKKGDFHDGIDVPGEDLPVYAFADGKVESVCRGECGGLGNNVLILHENGWRSRYNHLKKISRGIDVGLIERGEQIGTTGNTGRSFGAHLDFKVFTGEVGIDKGSNPLCFFSDGDLARLQFTGQNCNYNTPLHQRDPTWMKECEGLPKGTVEDANGCFFQTVSVGTGGNSEIATVLERLNELGVMDELTEGAIDANIDPNLVIAVITHETGGTADPTLVNAGGDVGIAQFSPIGGRDEPDFFQVSKIRDDCKCGDGDPRASLPGVCDGSRMPECAGDPRLDARASVIASGAHLAKGYYDSVLGTKTERLRLTIASYNAGVGAVRSAIQETGREDPTWENVRPHLPKITQGYVDKVMGHYAALGGSAPSTFTDQVCKETKLTTKELGTYTFKPHFSVSVPDILAPATNLLSWASGTYEECVGENNRECLFERKKEEVSGVEFLGCTEVEHDANIGLEFREFLTDCQENQQDDCHCVWYPPDKELEVQLYSGVPRVFVDGEAVDDIPPDAAETRFDIDGETTGVLSLRQQGDIRSLVQWSQPESAEGAETAFAEEETVITVPAFMLEKRDDDLVWVSETETQACGVYKQQHRICAQITTPTYALSTGKQRDPVVQFSMYLRDEVLPENVVNAQAEEIPDEGGLLSVFVERFTWVDVTLGDIVVTFEPSPSEDVSYYVVECVGLTDAEPVKILGRSVNPAGLDTRINDELHTELSCEGITEGIDVVITTYDTAGNSRTSDPIPIKSADEGLVDDVL